MAGAGKRQQLAAACHASGMLPWLTRARALFKQDLRILAYHRVRDVADAEIFSFDMALISASPAAFREQMRHIREHYAPVSLDAAVAALDGGPPLPAKAVVVTFDDGYDDNYHVAFPILRELGLPATFFVSTAYIDSGLPYALDWLVHMLCTTPAQRVQVPELAIDRAWPSALVARRAAATDLLYRLKNLAAGAQLGVIERLEQAWQMPRSAGHDDCRPMRWAQLREMHAAGMQIGSHGLTHQVLAKLPAAALARELEGSHAMLTQQLGVAPTLLSYPVGGFDAFGPSVMAAAEAAGFKLACSYIAGTSRVQRRSRFAMRRLPVEHGTDVAAFAALLAWPELFVHPTQRRAG